MPSITTFLAGKKTYIIAFVVALLAGAQALGYTIPEYVYVLLSAAGLGSFRSALNNINVSAPVPEPTATVTAAKPAAKPAAKK
jgi:hypothetical protein